MRSLECTLINVVTVFILKSHYGGVLVLLKLLCDIQDKFVSQLTILVKKKQLVELTVDEGWFSESEMKQDLKWTQFCPQ